MINVKIYRNENLILGFSISGHSDYRPRGSDIVCSAISALSQTAILAMEELAHVNPLWTRVDGLLECKLPDHLDPEASKTTQIILATIILGIENIASEYSRYVKVTSEEV